MTTMDVDLLHKSLEHEDGLQAMKYCFIKWTETTLFQKNHCENCKVDFRDQCAQKQLHRQWVECRNGVHTMTNCLHCWSLDCKNC